MLVWDPAGNKTIAFSDNSSSERGVVWMKMFQRWILHSCCSRAVCRGVLCPAPMARLWARPPAAAEPKGSTVSPSASSGLPVPLCSLQLQVVEPFDSSRGTLIVSEPSVEFSFPCLGEELRTCVSHKMKKNTFKFFFSSVLTLG